MSYFRFARAIADAMIARLFDPVAGGFFDVAGAAANESAEESNTLGILGTRRKPFQDSPTPAGNSGAAIALLRLHGYTNEASYRDKAEQTLEVFAGVAGQHGIFAATYGLAVMHFSHPHTQVVVVGQDEAAGRLFRAAARPLGLNTAVLRLAANGGLGRTCRRRWRRQFQIFRFCRRGVRSRSSARGLRVDRRFSTRKNLVRVWVRGRVRRPDLDSETGVLSVTGLKSVRENSVVPPGLAPYLPLSPALKRRAIGRRPSGAGFSPHFARPFISLHRAFRSDWRPDIAFPS